MHQNVPAPAYSPVPSTANSIRSAFFAQEEVAMLKRRAVDIYEDDVPAGKRQAIEDHPSEKCTPQTLLPPCYFLALPIEIRNLIYEYILDASPPLEHDLAKIYKTPSRYFSVYKFASTPEEQHHALRFTSQQLKAEFDMAIEHLVKSRRMRYDLIITVGREGRQFPPLHWIRFPALCEKVDTLRITARFALSAYKWELGVGSQFGEDEYVGLFGQLEQFLRLCTRTLRKRRGGGEKEGQPFTIGELVVESLTPVVPVQVIKKNGFIVGVSKEHRPISKMDAQYDDVVGSTRRSLQNILVRYPMALQPFKCTDAWTRIERVRFEFEGQTWVEARGLVLPPKRERVSDETMDLRNRPKSDFLWACSGSAERS